MYSLVYVSSATTAFSDADLATLLEKSQRDNALRDISGMLLFRDGNFMQLLEGEQQAVDALFKKIVLDSRHAGAIKMLNGDVEARSFPDWSMAFRNLNDASVRSLPGFSDFLNTDPGERNFFSNPTRATKLLNYFKQSMR
jgi:hypothetical protein